MLAYRRREDDEPFNAGTERDRSHVRYRRRLLRQNLANRAIVVVGTVGVLPAGSLFTLVVVVPVIVQQRSTGYQQ